MVKRYSLILTFILFGIDLNAQYMAVCMKDGTLICRSGNTYTGSFTEGLMLASYGAAVPAGWLTFLPYIIIGRPTSTEEQIAKVRLIVPHTMGHQFAAESVTPYYYEITIQE